MTYIEDSVILFLEVTNYVFTAITRAVIHDDELKIIKGLREDTRYGPNQQSIMSPTVCWHYHTHQWLIYEFLRLSYSLVFKKLSKTQWITSYAIVSSFYCGERIGH